MLKDNSCSRLLHCARNALDCLLYMLRLAAKLDTGCSFNQPCRRWRRSTRYSRNNLGVAARNFTAVTERIQQALLLPHIGLALLYWLVLPLSGEFMAALN